MKLWILKPVKPWEPWYDKVDGFVVRAVDEGCARALARKQAGDEGEGVWLDSTKTTCNELSKRGEQCVILRDFNGA